MIMGAGGHAKVLIDALKKLDRTILGILDPSHSMSAVLGIPVLGGDEELERYPPDQVDLINGLGSFKMGSSREQLFNKFKDRDYNFSSVIHPNAILSESCCLGEGVQILAGAIIQVGVELGQNVIVNTGALVDHDCHIGEHCHIAPGVALSGNVIVNKGTHVGTGTTIIQGIEIGEECLIGAGSVVIRSLPDGVQAYGNPATIRNTKISSI